MEIIPAIDIIDGSCVRLTQGDYNQKTVYSSHPIDVAKQFEDHGIHTLHLVDLDGAKNGKITNLGVLESITKHTNLQIDFGGGVKTSQDVQQILNAGATWVTIGSLAVKHPEIIQEFIQTYGAEKFMLGADVKNELLQIHGWIESTQVHVHEFIAKYLKIGVKRFFCTDISKDGMMKGPALDLYKKIIATFPEIFLIASGGVSSLNDLDYLKACGCKAVIVGKAIYEGKISLAELNQWNQQNVSAC